MWHFRGIGEGEVALSSAATQQFQNQAQKQAQPPTPAEQRIERPNPFKKQTAQLEHEAVASRSTYFDGLSSSKRNHDLVREALEQAERKKAKPYLWPAPRKGMSSAQATAQAQASTKRLLDGICNTTPPSAARSVKLDGFVKVEIDEIENAPPLHPNVEALEHHSLDAYGRTVDGEGLPIEWPWQQAEAMKRRAAGGYLPIFDMANSRRSTRAVREEHRYDALINHALDKASADGDRGRTKTGVKAWVAFCTDIMGTSPDRPMDPLTTSLWDKLEDEWLAMRFVCALVEDRGISPRSAASYFSSVQGWHAREHGVKLCGGLKLERLPQMLKGLRRVIGDAPKQMRRGVAPQALKKAMDMLLDPSDAHDANIRAALATALQGLLRSGEYTSSDGSVTHNSLLRSDLTELTEKRAVLMMHPCKNMNHLHGKTCPLVIGAGGESVDAVWELNNLFRVDPVSATEMASTPLFRDPITNKSVRYDTINAMVKRLMESVGENPEHFSTHSLRIGGATALFAAGANETIIRTMGRWSSDIYRLYTRACFEQCCEWTRKAGSQSFSDMSGLAYDEVDDY